MMELERELPAVALRGMIFLPGIIAQFNISRTESIRAVEAAMREGQQLFLVTQRDSEEENPDIEGLYRTGVITEIRQVMKLPKGVVRVQVEIRERALLVSWNRSREKQTAEVTCLLPADQEPESETEREAMVRSVAEAVAEYEKVAPTKGKELLRHVMEGKNPGELLDEIGNSLPCMLDKKQEILDEFLVPQRLEKVLLILRNEIEVTKIKNELQEEVKKRVDRNQKEYVLREQMQVIREELGEDTTESDADHFREAADKLKADASVKEKIRKEISRYQGMAGNSAERNVLRGYIETLLELPWNKMSKDNRDIRHAEQILAEDHYGLDQVKERILEFLSVRNLTSRGDSPIICLVGPPGTGKTSIAKSVARALGKKYVRISLGGVRDEAEIRGHRRTYVGAMPGRIVNALRTAGVKNPLILLDEVDKMSSDYKGDTASALLEVLDAEQNSRFLDHYIEIPVDLSQVLFIATANSAQTIPSPLLDRMEMIEVSSYTENEKFHIAKEHLIRKQKEKNGLKTEQLSISDNALLEVISGYTREAGVRSLERRIGELCRKAARRIYTEEKKSIRITEGNLSRYLGNPRYHSLDANETDEVGIVRGLAWTSVGGDTLQIEVNTMPGKGEFVLTGQLGDVMKESAQAGISYIRSVSSRYEIPDDYFREHDIHIHIPEGAVPKDGPSAGITMATAMLSAITGRPVRCDVAMTGEITLRGRVLPIGGLKEKILAAKNAKIGTVLVPKKNQPDIEELDSEIRGGIEIRYVETMEDVISAAFSDEGRSL